MLSANGLSGVIYKGYRACGTFKDWSLSATGQVEGVMVSLNARRMEQGGEVSIWLKIGRRYLVFRHADVSEVRDRLVAIVAGSPEIKHLEG